MDTLKAPPTYIGSLAWQTLLTAITLDQLGFIFMLNLFLWGNRLQLGGIHSMSQFYYFSSFYQMFSELWNQFFNCAGFPSPTC